MNSEPIEYIGCAVKELPEADQIAAAATAKEHNPANCPPDIGALAALALVDVSADVLTPGFLAAITSKYWRTNGVKLGVSFLDSPSPELRDRIISHANAWGKYANVAFAWSQSGGEVRINRGQGGYWSYLGTDILHVRGGEPTMNLQGFTMGTRESEFVRVVRHEVGHTLGFPHEHARRAIVQRLDARKTILYFRQTQGWDANTVNQQILTPLEEKAIIGTPVADETSIMTYPFPGSITEDGKPIPGGADINATDGAFAAKLYPLATVPPPVEPPVVGKVFVDLTVPAAVIARVNGVVVG